LSTPVAINGMNTARAMTIKISVTVKKHFPEKHRRGRTVVFCGRMPVCVSPLTEIVSPIFLLAAILSKKQKTKESVDLIYVCVQGYPQGNNS